MPHSLSRLPDHPNSRKLQGYSIKNIVQHIKIETNNPHALAL